MRSLWHIQFTILAYYHQQQQEMYQTSCGKDIADTIIYSMLWTIFCFSNHPFICIICCYNLYFIDPSTETIEFLTVIDISYDLIRIHIDSKKGCNCDAIQIIMSIDVNNIFNEML